MRQKTDQKARRLQRSFGKGRGRKEKVSPGQDVNPGLCPVAEAHMTKLREIGSPCADEHMVSSWVWLRLGELRHGKEALRNTNLP